MDMLGLLFDMFVCYFSVADTVPITDIHKYNSEENILYPKHWGTVEEYSNFLP
jgi:hypothetical protein